MSAPGLSFGFRIYTLALAASLTAVLVAAFDVEHLTVNPLAALVLGSLFLLAERANLSYYDGSARWGLSLCEAILLPMLVALSFVQVVGLAMLGMGIARLGNWRKTPLREVFNVAQYGCAAAVAANVWMALAQGSSVFSIQNAGAAAAGVLSFAVLTHVFVALGFHLARRGSFFEALRDVAPAAAIGLAGNIVLGLLFAAAYTASHWTVLLFPLPLGALYFGFRAIARSSTERRRIEQLHSASRALSAYPDPGDSIVAFLGSVAEMLSAHSAGAVTPTGSGLVWSCVRHGETVARTDPRMADEVTDLFSRMQADGRPLTPDDGLMTVAIDGEDNVTIAVPLIEEGEIRGLVAVAGRSGADEFDSADVALLDALSNELVLSLRSRNLFDEVAEERERFQLLVEALSDYAIYMTDPKGYVVSWNAGAERIFGYTTDEIVGEHYSRFAPSEEDKAKWEKELARAVTQGPREAESMRVRKDGSTFLANRVVSPVRDGSGSLRGFAMVTRDITDKVRAQEERDALENQLQQAQRLESVGQLAGGIAHDFNNLLSVIINSAHFALEDLDDGTIKEDVQEILGASERAAALTRQLLVFSRRDAVEPQIIDLNMVISNMEKLLWRAVGEQVVMRVELSPDLDTVLADTGQIEQVLMNLAVNARDAMKGGGTLTIQTENRVVDEAMAKRYMDLSPGQYVLLRVTDTGSGMTPEVLAKAFEPFFSTKPKGSGTGLGLATVYGIVTGAAGHIDVHSTPGLGTTFEIYLPMCEDEVAIQVEGRPALVSSGEGETILLVEDEDSVRSIARRILTGGGYRVIEARDASEALDHARSVSSDIRLLLSDVVMPGMSGMELVERLTARNPRLKVIYMSGYNEQVFSSEIARDGIPLIQKPFAQHDLLEKVRDVLDG